MLGPITLILILGSGIWLARKGLGLRHPMEGALVGMLLAAGIFLLLFSTGMQWGLQARNAAFMAAIPMVAGAFWAGRRPDSPRPAPALGRLECALLGLAMMLTWCFLNLQQVITVDDDYWMHTPVQGRMLRGVFPPTNPFFPNLVLGGHYGRDMLVVGTSVLSGRDIWGAQVLVTSFTATAGLGVLYLAIRRCGSGTQAASAVFLAWLGVNLAHRCGLADFYFNNGGPTYAFLALLLFLYLELWRQPGRKLTCLCGMLLGVYATVYETHFGLVVLTVLTLLPLHSRPARLASLQSLALAGLLAVTGSGAIARISSKTPRLDPSVANQSQSVQISFPKIPVLCLQIQKGEIEPVSCGYRYGLGKSLLKMVDHKSSVVNDRYVRIWSWMALRMHWIGLWLAPLSAWAVFSRRHEAGQFLLVFATWGFLVPGLVDFGPIHEYEWFRWEFAAGYGFAAALGIAMGGLVKTWRGGIALALALIVICHAGLDFLRVRGSQWRNPRPEEILGLSFHSTDYLMRHGEFLRFRGSDLRALAWIDANSDLGTGALLATTGPQEPWGILFESTAMGLANLQALGHELPDPKAPIGVPPFRLDPSYQEMLHRADIKQARRRGITWILLRSDDWLLEKALLQKFRLVSYDSLAPDGKRRLLLTTLEEPLLRRPATREGVSFTYPLPSGTFVELSWDRIPVGAREMSIRFLDGENFLLGPPATLPALSSVNLAVPTGCRLVEIHFFAQTGETLAVQSFPPGPAAVKNPPESAPRLTQGTRPLPGDRLQ